MVMIESMITKHAPGHTSGMVILAPHRSRLYQDYLVGALGGQNILPHPSRAKISARLVTLLEILVAAVIRFHSGCKGLP